MNTLLSRASYQSEASPLGAPVRHGHPTFCQRAFVHGLTQIRRVKGFGWLWSWLLPYVDSVDLVKFAYNLRRLLTVWNTKVPLINHWKCTKTFHFTGKIRNSFWEGAQSPPQTLILVAEGRPFPKHSPIAALTSACCSSRYFMPGDAPAAIHCVWSNEVIVSMLVYWARKAWRHGSPAGKRSACKTTDSDCRIPIRYSYQACRAYLIFPVRLSTAIYEFPSQNPMRQRWQWVDYIELFTLVTGESSWPKDPCITVSVVNRYVEL